MAMEGETRILAPVSNSHIAGMLAGFTMNMAEKIGGHVIAVHVVDRRKKSTELDGLKALDIFSRVGEAHNVSVATLLLEGKVKDILLDTIENKNIDIVVMGRSKEALRGFLGEDLASEIAREVDIPIVMMPHREELMSVKRKGKSA
jgi:nucleotide-binding universal stress UspA family protein